MYNTDIEKSNRSRIIGIDEWNYICCCGCHVISCTKFVSIHSIVLSAITLLSSLFSSSSCLSADYFTQSIGKSWFEQETVNSVSKGNMVNCVIDIILNAGVLYGIYRIKPVVLLPYIIVKTFFLIIFGLSIIIGLITLAVLMFVPAIGLGVFFGVIGLVGALGLVGAIGLWCNWFLVQLVFGAIASTVDLGFFMMFYLIIVGASVLGLFFIGYLFVHMFYRTYNYLKEVELGRYTTIDQMQNVPTYQ